MKELTAILLFPNGLSLILLALAYSWANRKLLARYQSRLGPVWYQPFADTLKLLSKDEMSLHGTDSFLLRLLPILALAGCLTAALYLPLLGLQNLFSFEGDFIVVLYLLSLNSFALGLVGLLVKSRVSALGSSRVMSQLFAYEVPFLVAVLAALFGSGSWQISKINQTAQWTLLSQPLGFLVAIISLMAKLELAPFDAPQAETEIVAGALTEYSGRSLALFKLAKAVSLLLGLTLLALLYLGRLSNPIEFVLKTLFLLLIVTTFEALFARLRIDQSLKLWWRGLLFVGLLQWAWLIGWELFV
jgi:NADH-quinone oxidoreductase subunit H